MDYLLSIIIPEYNQNYVYLKQCLDSIFIRQQDVDFRRIQVILVKDSLEDDITDFYRYPIEVLQTTGHTGCGIARQIGLNAATGEWIYFIDSDDYLLTPQSLRYRIKEIEAHPEALRFNFSYLRENDYTVQTYGLNALYGSIYKRSLINKYGLHFLPERERYEDVAFVSTYSYLVGSENIHSSTTFPIYYYRDNHNSLTKINQPAGYYGKMDLWSMNYTIRTLMKEHVAVPDSVYQFWIFRLTREMASTDFKAILGNYLSEEDRRNFNWIREQAGKVWARTTEKQYQGVKKAFDGLIKPGQYPQLDSIAAIVELCKVRL